MTQPDFIGMKFLLIPLNIQTSSLVDLMAAHKKIKDEWSWKTPFLNKVQCRLHFENWKLNRFKPSVDRLNNELGQRGISRNKRECGILCSNLGMGRSNMIGTNGKSHYMQSGA